MKDFYDIYYFLTKLRKEINIIVLKEAVNNTFTKRDSFEYLSDYEQIIDSIIENERIKKLWNIYSSKYKYANSVDINKVNYAEDTPHNLVQKLLDKEIIDNIMFFTYNG